MGLLLWVSDEWKQLILWRWKYAVWVMFVMKELANLCCFQTKERGSTRVHALNNVNKVLQVLHQNNVSTFFLFFFLFNYLVQPQEPFSMMR